MSRLRSLSFYLFLGVAGCVYVLLFGLTRLRGREGVRVTRNFLKWLLWGLEHICGLRYRVVGRENFPDTPCLIASGQQSTWENIAFQQLFDDPAIFAKAELYNLPVVGWIVGSVGHIPIARDGDLAATKAGIERARQILSEGRNVLIFSEGTRNTTPGDAHLKGGTGALYTVLRKPCVPVVLNSGDYWPYGGYIISPGTITVEILEPIAPGLGRDEFRKRLKEKLDSGSIRLSRRTRVIAPTHDLQLNA